VSFVVDAFKGEVPSHLEDSPMPNFAQQRDRLQPSEALFKRNIYLTGFAKPGVG
jgi:hypothetical protein